MSTALTTQLRYPPKRILSNLDWAVLGVYYAFVFSIPFQTLDLGLPAIGTLSKWIGYLFVMLTVLKPRLCYRIPSPAAWCFAIYLVIFVFSGLLGSDAWWASYVLDQFKTLIQLFILFWTSSNLLRYNSRIIRRALFSLA